MPVEAIWKEKIIHIPERRKRLFQYDELSESAKDCVRKKYLEDELEFGFRQQMLTEDFMRDFVNYFFPNSELEVSWNLSCNQGDYVEIYGKIQWYDMFKYLQNYKTIEHDGIPLYIPWDFTSKEERRIYHYIRHFDIKISSNDRLYDRYFSDDWESELEWQGYADIDYNLIYKLNRIVISAIEQLTDEMKSYGYKFLSEVDDDEMSQMASGNDWLYYEDGLMYDDDADELQEVG